MNKNNCIVLYLASKWGKNLLKFVALIFGILIVALTLIYGIVWVETLSLYLFNSSNAIWYIGLSIGLIGLIITAVKDLITIGLKDIKTAKEKCD